jgi:tetrapyrrole methylase family protein/MazG family protein
MNNSNQNQFVHLVTIMKRLRQECPWDREQTAESLRKYIIEEAYEVIEAIDNKDWQNLAEELGDLLLQIIFQSVIAEEKELFTLEKVLKNINQKLIERHPHVFADVQINSAAEVEKNWEKIKSKSIKKDSLLSGVPASAPALLKAQRIQEKASRVSFDWENTHQVLEKVDEEMQELRMAIKNKDMENMEEELGDLLFSIVNLSRFLSISAEDALRAGNNKFVRRFMQLEKVFNNDYDKMKQAGLKELDRLWESFKSKDSKNVDN